MLKNLILFLDNTVKIDSITESSTGVYTILLISYR